MASSSDIFNQVRSAVDIVDVIGEHVALKRAGREFKGLCPFHEDHRPSMAVVPHKQIFHCFVCGTGGDVFKFVELYHKMTKGETLRMLAQLAGIKLPELPGRSAGPSKDKDGLSARERIALTNEWACSLFEKNLRTSEGKIGLDYFYSRGLTDETIARFRLGFALDSWTGLVNAALRAGISNERLLEAGLIKQRQDSSPYDAFRNRVIFPIIDATGGAKGTGGRVIAFGGRVLEEKRDEAGNVVEAKYLNSPDSPLFNKSESLYGLNLARQQIVRTRTAIVVEGYMDVIACHQAAVTNTVATLGTALTAEHSKTVKNYAQVITLMFDSDDAGRRAADRAMEVFVRSPMDVKIASVPDGKDPCDFCMKHGGEAFQKIVDAAKDALTFQWDRLQTRYHGTDSVGARQEAVTEFMRFAAASMEGQGGFERLDPIRRGQLIVKLAGIVGLSVEEVTGLLFRYSRLKPTNRETADPSQKSPAALMAESEREFHAAGNTETTALRDAQRWLLGFILFRPAHYLLVREEMSMDLFPHDHLAASLLLEYLENTDETEWSLAGYTSFLAERENTDPVVHAAILWERMAANWVELNNISEAIAKLVHYLRAELGHTEEKIVRDCLQYLIDAAEDRMRLYNQQLRAGETSLDQHLDDIKAIADRMKAGKNLRSVGYRAQRESDFQAMQRAANEALRATA